MKKLSPRFIAISATSDAIVGTLMLLALVKYPFNGLLTGLQFLYFIAPLFLIYTLPLGIVLFRHRWSDFDRVFRYCYIIGLVGILLLIVSIFVGDIGAHSANLGEAIFNSVYHGVPSSMATVSGSYEILSQVLSYVGLAFIGAALLGILSRLFVKKSGKEEKTD
jgi:MFS superfamily sulfate permease-like transporter